MLFLLAPIVVACIGVALMLHVLHSSSTDARLSETAGTIRAACERINDRLGEFPGSDPATLDRDITRLDASMDELGRASLRKALHSDANYAPAERDIETLRGQWARMRPRLVAWTRAQRPPPPSLVSLAGDLNGAAALFEERSEILYRTDEREHLALIAALLLLQILGLMAAAIARTLDMRRIRRHEQEIADLSLVSERTDSGILLCGPGGRARWANGAFLRTFGWRAAEVPGRSALELLSVPAGQGHDTTGLGAAIAKSLRHAGEFELRRRDGTILWANVELVPLEGEPGGVDQLALMISDVTGRVLAAQALRTSETRFRSALAALNEGFLLFDADGRVVECNDEFLRITGFTRELVLGAAVGGFGRRLAKLGVLPTVRVDGAPLPPNEDPVTISFTTGQCCKEAVFGLHRPTGERRWVSTNTALFELPGSDRPGVVATMTDVTDRRAAEDMVRLLTVVVEDSPTIVMITGADDRLEYVNAAFAARTGWSLGEVRGRTPDFMLSDRTRAETWTELMSALQAGGSWRGEVYNTTRAGETWLAVSQVYVLRGADGQVTHHVALLQDITEQRSREEELARAREDALVAANAKSEFLQNMSHELRTPLNGVLGMSELLLQTPLDPGQRADLVQMRRSAEDLLTVINHLFDFARIQEGGEAREPVPFRLSGCLREVESSLAAAADARGLRWRVEVEPGLPDPRAGDPAALRQVLLCLASNAVKFTERGEVVLGVRAGLAHGDRPGVWFEMRDTGIGIPANRQADIFEAFEQLDGSTTRKYGGVGLGLALASRLVRRMGGSLEVASEPGKGSAFSFVIPLDVPPEGAGLADGPVSARLDPPPAVRPALPATTRPPGAVGAGHRVLLVEDNTVNRKVASRLLERSGYEVGIAVDGGDAVGMFRQGGWDIVLMDVQMPGMDGLEATRRIRGLEREGGMRRTPIVAVTAHTLDSDRSAVLEAGMDDLVPKPIVADHLLASIERHLHEAHPDPSGSPPPALEDVLDWREAVERMEGEVDMLEELLRIFLRDAPNIMLRLEEACASGDGAQLERAAHGLRGASGTLSARQVDRLARSVEELARAGRLDEARSGVDELRLEMLRLMRAIEGLPRGRRDVAA